MIDSTTIVTVVALALTIVSTLLGKKWQDAVGKAADLTQNINNVITAAKDNNVDEASFQKVVDDVKAILQEL